MSGDDASSSVRSYQLSADDNDRVFRRDIVPSELELVPSQEQPIVVFLIGQPGAGKSATADEIRDVFGDGGFVEVDSDIYKAYHPRYAEILRLDDTLMAAAIGPDGRAWMAKVQDYVRAHRLNALVHEIAQNPDYLVATATKYRDAGYRSLSLSWRFRTAAEPPHGPGWVYQPKLDGFRGCAWWNRRGRVRLLSRRGRSLTDAFPELPSRPRTSASIENVGVVTRLR
ncbi:zeta toxin family protein [Pseudonocardia sp. D17]|uniref:zeta toxin family protein n=1 Tax=Pseudonocardia sp. D17 TaxID=882661 RepID=UPI002B3BD0B2|nr:hypothetical protein PSD17_32280 [Pseudonocardia sp. D17]